MPGVVCLMKSLRLVKASHPLYVIHTGLLSEASLAAIAACGAIPIRVPQFRLEQELCARKYAQQCYQECWNKLWMW